MGWRIGSDVSLAVLPAHACVSDECRRFTIQAIPLCGDAAKERYSWQTPFLKADSLPAACRLWATTKRPHAVCGKSTLEQEFLSTACFMRLGSEANGQLQRSNDGGQMIAYLVNQTAYPAKKAHTNDRPSRQFSPIGPFWSLETPGKLSA
jgi:hypothetical protein